VTPSDDSSEGVDSRQLLLASVCLVGLVTAALLAPVTGENDPVGIDGGVVPTDILEFLFDRSPDSVDDGSGDENDEESGDDGGGGGLPEWLRDLLDDVPGIDWDERQERDTGPTNPCQVYIGISPNPGTETTVLVTVEEEPASDVRVWFNGEYVGRTSEQGTVTGEVPYVEELEVTVESPTERPCAFSREPAVGAVEERTAHEQRASQRR